MKVKYSALVSDMRGKLNGSVASKNRYGSYLRNKITPSNPQTSAQVAQRSRLASISSSWRSLTEEQRSAWNDAVDGYKKTNIFGDVVTPSGNVLFSRLNLNLATIGQSPINLPPLPVGAVAPESVSASASVATDEVMLEMAENTVPADHILVVEATPQLSPGIFNANNKFRIIDNNVTLTAGEANLHTQFIAKFGELVVGMKFFVRVSYYNQNTGEKSLALKTSAIVGA